MVGKTTSQKDIKTTLVKDLLLIFDDHKQVDISVVDETRSEGHITLDRVVRFPEICGGILSCKVVKIKAENSTIFVSIDPYPVVEEKGGN